MPPVILVSFGERGNLLVDQPPVYIQTKLSCLECTTRQQIIGQRANAAQELSLLQAPELFIFRQAYIDGLLSFGNKAAVDGASLRLER